MDTLKPRVGAGWFDSSCPPLGKQTHGTRKSRAPTRLWSRETAAAGRRHPAGLSRPPPQRLQIQVESSICFASPPPQSFSSSAQPIHLLARSTGDRAGCKSGGGGGRSFPPASILVGRPRRPPSPTTSATVGASSVERCPSSVCNFSGRLFEKLDDVLARLLSLFKIDCVPSIFMTTNREFPSRCLSIVSGNQQ